MRFRSLSLEKFGVFEGRSLAFRPDAKLHIVHGPNGAGKSTALAAVGALLFGVPESTPYAFRFDGPELRIGAEIEARDGRVLAFRRRKGRRNTLLDAKDRPAPEDALAPFLGGVGEEVFHRSFGLDAGRLREGGEAMLKADGDLGASMMAAASGLRGLAELRQAFDDEADGVFGERKAERRRFYQALDRFEAARKAIRDTELRVEDWKKRDAGIDELARKLDAIRGQRRAAEAERARLSRLRRARPVLKDIREREARLEDFADLPVFPAGAAERLRSALDEARASGKAAEDAEDEARRLTEDLAAIEVDATVLADAAAIESLFQASGGYVNEKRDLPRVQADADGVLETLKAHAGDLGMSDVGLLESRRPTAAAIADVRELIDEGRRAEAAQAARCQQLAGERNDFEALRLARDRQSAAIDPAPLRKKFAALGEVGERARALSVRRAELIAERRELDEAVARLDPPAATLDVLARTPAPAPSDLTRFARAFESAEREARDAAKGREAAESEIIATKARLAKLIAGSPLATSDLIGEERGARDKAWRLLRAALLEAADAPPAAGIPARVIEFEERSGRADRLSDEAARDAERLAAHALETRRLDEQARACSLALAAVEKASARCAQIHQDWAELWKDACHRPKAPAEMRIWKDRVEHLVAARDKLMSRQARHDAEESDLARIGPALRALAASAGVEPETESGLAHLAGEVELRLEDLASQWQASRDLETRFAEAQRRLGKAGEEAGEAMRRLDDWRGRWGAAVAAIGLEGCVSIKAANAALEIWDRALNDAASHHDFARRATGMRRDMEEFEAQAEALVQRCAPEAADLPAETVARRLNERLARAREAEARRADVARRLEAVQSTLEEARKRRGRAAEALAALTARLPEGADPAGLLSRETERSRLAEALRERRLDLIAFAEGVDEARLACEMEGFDPDAAAARVAELERAEKELGLEENEVYAERKRLLRERAELENGVGAEAAWQRRRNAEAELIEAARRWAVLRGASLLLGKALDQHSIARRDPLIHRAGEGFATLTGGAFSGLGQSFDDKDQPRLAARRPNGGLVPIKGLSDGERDQFYLALRLAYIEDYASRAEAPPFVGDDIFPSFDDPRTAHGLEALAAIADRVQPILFTHHLHVVETARSRLGDAVDVIRIG